jgi:acyl carrier protein
MTAEERLALVRSVLREVAEPPAVHIGPETRLAELGVDSVALAEIVVRIEEEAGIEVPPDRWLRVRDVAEVLDMIEQALQRH